MWRLSFPCIPCAIASISPDLWFANWMDLVAGGLKALWWRNASAACTSSKTCVDIEWEREWRIQPICLEAAKTTTYAFESPSGPKCNTNFWPSFSSNDADPLWHYTYCMLMLQVVKSVLPWKKAQKCARLSRQVLVFLIAHHWIV